MKFKLTSTIQIVYSIFVVLGITKAEAVTAPTSGKYMYFGTLWVTALTTPTNCSNAGYSVGSRYLARLRPPALGNNGANWNFNIFDNYSAEGYKFNSTPTSTLSTATQAFQISGGISEFNVTPQVSITSQTPSTITTPTSYVYMEGKIRNIGDNASYALTASNYDGCDVTFRFSGVLKP